MYDIYDIVSFLLSDQVNYFVNNIHPTPASVKNRSRKPITITICNQMLLKCSVIGENEINDKAYCYTWAVLGLIGSNMLIQRD